MSDVIVIDKVCPIIVQMTVGVNVNFELIVKRRSVSNKKLQSVKDVTVSKLVLTHVFTRVQSAKRREKLNLIRQPSSMKKGTKIKFKCADPPIARGQSFAAAYSCSLSSAEDFSNVSAQLTWVPQAGIQARRPIVSAVTLLPLQFGFFAFLLLQVLLLFSLSMQTQPFLSHLFNLRICFLLFARCLFCALLTLTRSLHRFVNSLAWRIQLPLHSTYQCLAVATS